MRSKKSPIRQSRLSNRLLTQSTTSLERGDYSHALDLAFQAFQQASSNFNGSVAQATALAEAYKKIYLALLPQGKSREALTYLSRGLSFAESHPVQVAVRQELRSLWTLQQSSTSKPRVSLPRLQSGGLLRSKSRKPGKSAEQSILALIDRAIAPSRETSQVLRAEAPVRKATSVLRNTRSFNTNLESAKKLYRGCLAGVEWCSSY